MRKMRVAVALMLMLIMVALVGCGGGSKSPSTGSGDGKGLKVAYVISGLLGDKSFFDSGMAGLERAKQEFGIEIKVIQSAEAAEWEPNLKAAADGDYDLIIAGASQYREAIINLAPKYPDKKFVYLDDVVDVDNVASVDYAEEEGSFLAGALGALMSETKTIGYVGGMDIAVLHNFLEGYRQGAQAVDPSVKVIHAFADSFNDPAQGKELTLAQYSQGADVVFNVAGGTGAGVIAAAKEAGKYAIGVDTDQDNEAPGHVLSSMLKRVDNSTYDMVKLVADGQWKGGLYKYGLKENGVGLTDMSVMGDKISQEVRDKLKELTDKVASGEIKVEEYTGDRKSVV